MNRTLLLSAATLLTACDGAPLTEGLEEPIRVNDAQFVEGELPGTPPLTAAQIQEGMEAEGPRVTTVSFVGRGLTVQETSIAISGHASPDAYAVGMAIEGQGKGYWLLPVGFPDPTQALIDGKEQFGWSTEFDLGASIEPGLRRLLLAGIDENGNSGTQFSGGLCVVPPVPDNGNACNPALEPPAFVVSLAWSNAADLDLRVVEPGDVVISNDTPTGKDGKGEGRLVFDANSSCVRNGIIRENVVWQNKPRPGTYLVYVNLHSTCGEHAAPFTLTTHARESKGDEFRQVETFNTTGNFVELQANGGRSLGLFVTEFEVN